ncbi:MAG: class I SAM-dependent methyltransferase [Candidatus Omnitrophica bacterium]|nr:class I SAM-dependent methyltransferase [Candidatus Omnitrophota bacterium]
MKTKTSRRCPLCEQDEPRLIMQLTLDQIVRANPAYERDVIEQALTGEEGGLTYSQCHGCGMVYCPHSWGDEVLKVVYGKALDYEKSRANTLSIHKRIWLVDLWGMLLRLVSIQGYEKLGGLKLIDYGCGWGDFLEVVKGYGVEGTGYDEDPKKVKFAAERGVRVARNMEELSSFGPVDIFVMNSVLEHLQDPASILKYAWDHLQPGGYLMFGVMDYRKKFLARNAKTVGRGNPASTHNLNPIEHVNIYDYRTARASGQKAGFRFLGTETVLRWAMHPRIRLGRPWMWLFNEMERLSYHIVKDGDRPLTMFFRKPV